MFPLRLIPSDNFQVIDWNTKPKISKYHCWIENGGISHHPWEFKLNEHIINYIYLKYITWNHHHNRDNEHIHWG